MAMPPPLPLAPPLVCSPPLPLVLTVPALPALSPLVPPEPALDIVGFGMHCPAGRAHTKPSAAHCSSVVQVVRHAPLAHCCPPLHCASVMHAVYGTQWPLLHSEPAAQSAVTMHGAPCVLPTSQAPAMSPKMTLASATLRKRNPKLEFIVRTTSS
jgi:hypothetical protein